MPRQTHVVFMNVAATGHMNPTLPVVAELKLLGCTVSYFVDESMRDVVEAAGARWYPFRYPNTDMTGTFRTLDDAAIAKYVPRGTPQDEYDEMPSCLLYNAEAVLPQLLEDLRALEPRPSVVVYEPFLAFAQVAAHVMRLPAVCILTMPGPGVLAKSNAMIKASESKPWVEGPRQHIFAQYGFDVFEHGLQMECYSPILNLVTTIDELYVPPNPGAQFDRYGRFPFKCVGVLADSKVKRVDNAAVERNEESYQDTLLAEVDGALNAGRRIVYVSLGTVATSHFYDKRFGTFGNDNGLSDCTGKQLIQHVFTSCFEALGNDEDIVVVLSTGPKDDIFEGLPPIPQNFLVRKAVPQLEILKRTSAFITHGGANSMHEALSIKVPMCVVPIFGDQPQNADSIAAHGAGLAFRNPLSSVTPIALRTTIDEFLQPKQGNSFYEAAAELSDKLVTAGGAPMAATAILALAVQPGTAKGGA